MNLIYSVGTKVVALRDVEDPPGRRAHPTGAVGVVVQSPSNRSAPYRVRFIDGVEAKLFHAEIERLAEFSRGDAIDASDRAPQTDLYDRVFLRCVVGSRAFGLDSDGSDTDRRGVYLPPAIRHWSLVGVPEQLENDATQEVYWELQKFLVLALKANPNVLETLYSPLVEFATPLGKRLIAMRSIFLSRMIYQTYNGYVLSQFKKSLADRRLRGAAKPKHSMHLLRLLLSGIAALREGSIRVNVGEHREKLLAVRSGEMTWEEVEAWRKELHDDFDRAYAQSALPDRPDYAAADAFLIEARRAAVEGELP
jgi:predicted nucleotidyltransferase